MHLYMMPTNILKRINAYISKFIWARSRGSNKIHLVCLEALTKNKDEGGWGLLNIEQFDRALLMKSLWGTLNGNGI